MNNTRILAIVAVLTAATLVVGLTVAATMTPSAFAGGSKKDGHDKYMGGGGQGNGGKDNGSGNTKTIQVLKQNAKSSAFTDGYKKDGHDKYVKGKGQDSYKKDGHDKYVKGKGQDSYKKDGKANGGKDNSSVVEQNGQNVICTHSGSTSPDNACTSQNNGLPSA
jgi:hypothetical protein